MPARDSESSTARRSLKVSRRVTATAAIVALIVCAVACRNGNTDNKSVDAEDTTTTTPDPLLDRPRAPSQKVDLPKVYQLEQARVLAFEEQKLATLADNRDVIVRSQVALAVGRIGDPNGLGILERLVTDESPDVRVAAATALGLLAAQHADDQELLASIRSLLFERWEAEGREQQLVLTALVWSMRKVGGKAANGLTERLVDGMNRANNSVEVAAMHSWALLARYQPETPGLVTESIEKRLRARATSSDPEVASAATYALFRGGGADSAEVLTTIARDPARSSVDRALALRTLTRLERYDPDLCRRLLFLPDPPKGNEPTELDIRGDWLTQVAAVRHLQKVGSPAAAALLLRLTKDLVRRAVGPGELLDEPELHVLLTVVGGVGPKSGRELVAQIERLHQGVAAASEGTISRRNARSLIACTASAALDRVGQKVAKVQNCSADLPYPLTEQVQSRFEIETILSADVALDDKARFASLQALSDRRPSAFSQILQALSGLLEEKKPGTDELRLDDELRTSIAKWAASGIGSTDPVAVATAATVVRLVKYEPARDAIVRKMKLIDTMGSHDKHAEAVIELSRALIALDGKEVATDLEPLLASDNVLIRTTLARELRKLDPEGTYVASPTELPVVTPQMQSRKYRAEVRTTRGNFVISVDNDQARAARAAFRTYGASTYRKTRFHRVIPNFVVQGGDPRGDGSGGPGRQLRAEWDARPYRRGTVGLAHAGKDTAGCQFFVTHSPQPHLEGGYTVLGDVVEGMDVVDKLQVGDGIISVATLPYDANDADSSSKPSRSGP